MDYTNFQLADTASGRLEQLKGFLRDHASTFDMGPWLEFDVNIPFFDNRSKMSSLPDAERVQFFESCGTACCIGGACEVLSGVFAGGDSAARYMGVQGPLSRPFGGDLAVFHVNNWPGKLQKEYRTAEEKCDYPAMVEAGIKAIDHFNASTDWLPDENDGTGRYSALADDYDDANND